MRRETKAIIGNGTGGNVAELGNVLRRDDKIFLLTDERPNGALHKVMAYVLTIDDSKTVEKCLVPFSPESALSGVMKGGTKFVYKRIFEVPQDWNGQRVLLHFGAVDWDTTVEVNGTK